MQLPGLQIAVIGGAACGEGHRQLAWEVGREISKVGVLLCGGGGGVMEAAAEGARSGGGLTVGILAGADPEESPPNQHIQLPIYTGLGQARNLVLVLSAQVVIAVGGEWGTLSEIALAIKHGRPVVRLDSWRLEPPSGSREPLLIKASSAGDAVRMAVTVAGGRV